MRKPFQGLGNIIRFNWHFYILSLIFLLLLWAIKPFFPPFFQLLIALGCAIILVITFCSLLVSAYIYDFSDLYTLNWLEELSPIVEGRMINIHAGFDETSELIARKYPQVNLSVLDFYDPKKHTEISILRARKAYPPYPNTQAVTTSFLPFESKSVDRIFLIFAAHEIRNEEERIAFFMELNRILKPKGQIVLTEHLRDFPNFIAYTIGFLHFYSRKTWLKTFTKSAFFLKKEIKITPFISTFILEKNGN